MFRGIELVLMVVAVVISGIAAQLGQPFVCFLFGGLFFMMLADASVSAVARSRFLTTQQSKETP